MPSLDLTPAEWRSLSCLPAKINNDVIPAAHQKKLILMGVAAEKSGNLVATFEGRLVLREHNRLAFDSRA